MNRAYTIAIWAWVWASVLVSNSHATEWPLCSASWQLPERPVAETTGGALGSTHVSADQANLVEDGISVLEGNVQIIRDTQQIQANRVELTQPGQVIDAEGDIKFWDKDLFVSGDAAHVEMETNFATVDRAQFMLLEGHGHGAAQKVIMPNQDVTQIKGATYTTCDPGKEDWLLAADEIELNSATEWGTARDVTIHFHGTPIFYSPWMTFPLTDRRKSGLLSPSYRISGETGFEVSVPYYWNIAPERDATLTTRGMTERGVLLGGEYRYLLPNYATGTLGMEVLPDDRAHGDSRSAVSFQHDGVLGAGWDVDIDVDWVSDKNYFEDLGTNLQITSTQFLDQRADLNYQHRNWSALARIQSYQVVDQTISAEQRPYKRLPQLLFTASTPNRNRRLNSDLAAEFVYFDRTSSITGTRLQLQPSVSYPMRSLSGFIVPRATLNFSTYSLNNTNAGAENSPSRLVPKLIVDSGLLFDRNLSLGSVEYLQTLEPRLFYLFVPHVGQDEIPLFDTGVYTFTFDQLFREDRFSGSDRIGDANQVSLSVTSRLLSNDNGKELLRASVGQSYFFRNREIQLLSTTPSATEDMSDIAGELTANLYNQWRVSAGFHWDPNEGRTSRNTIRARYKPTTNKIMNVEYRFVRDEIEQTDFSIRWPIKNHLGVVGRWNYAVPENRTLEATFGLEYDSCCWAGRLVARRHLNDTNGDFNNAIFLHLELKGLGGVGENTIDFLRKTISGYQKTF